MNNQGNSTNQNNNDINNNVNAQATNTNTNTNPSVQVNVSNNGQPQVPSNSNEVELLQDNTSNENNAYTNQNLKEVNINYSPPSKFKIALLIIFFVFLIGFVIFLPEINSFIETYKVRQNENTTQVITTGRLVCTLSRTTKNLDIAYESIFHFTDSKLNSLNYTTTTKGDADLDEATLNEEQDKCNLLKQHTELLRGVVVTCEYEEGKQTTTQNFTFGDINKEDMDAAYSEAGGVLIEYENEENIDMIEKNMKASGYTCQRRTN